MRRFVLPAHHGALQISDILFLHFTYIQVKDLMRTLLVFESSMFANVQYDIQKNFEAVESINSDVIILQMLEDIEDEPLTGKLFGNISDLFF